MPYRDSNAERMANRERQRRYRARQRAKREAPAVPVPAPVPDDPIGALAQWSREALRVPPGHPLGRSTLVPTGLRRGIPERRTHGARELALLGEEEREIGNRRGLPAWPIGRADRVPWIPRGRGVRVEGKGRRAEEADARDRGSLEARRAALPSLTGARAR